MKMFVSIFLLILISLTSHGQLFNVKPSDSTTIISPKVSIRKVSEYSADSCLLKLLRDVVYADRQTYLQGGRYYSLSFVPRKKTRFLLVTLERWNSAPYLDYTGVLRVDSGIFLLREGFNRDSIFSLIGNSAFYIKLARMDSVENTVLTIEPSLQGGFMSCQGLPINLEIYIPERIPGYDSKNKK
jgi:hypothetical protein